MKEICIGCNQEKDLSTLFFRGTFNGEDIYECTCGAIIRVNRFRKQVHEELNKHEYSFYGV
jgi:hypothetical protein